ncbi:MAG TPA: N-6 DNA methylase [Verrucomicrobiae bacterium]|nr:N-6 DNA methylase [Verrucomicrobiae bacterium]
MDAAGFSLRYPEVPGPPPRRFRRSAPGEGISLASATEAKAAGVREAVTLLATSFNSVELEEVFRSEFAPRWQLTFRAQDQAEPVESRAAWNLVATWCVAQASGQVPKRSGLTESVAWFRGSTPFPVPALTSLLATGVLWRAQQLLLSSPLDHDFWDLFPYILEAHGPGSRASVMRDPSTVVAREAKRKGGVFYTPSDVVDYMVSHTINNYAGDFPRAKCLDPACGTGVMLLGLLRAFAQCSAIHGRATRLDYITSSLYGCDISAHALDAATFVLLHQCLPELKDRGLSPWEAWHAIRLNFAKVDSITIASANGSPPSPSLNGRLATKQQLATASSTWLSPVEIPFHEVAQAKETTLGFYPTPTVPFQLLFPEASQGFDLLIANPPYAALGERSDYATLSQEYLSLAQAKPATRHNCFPLFVEMMWRLTSPKISSSALVTPLSIAFHRSSQYEGCRYGMYWQGGKWQLAFFDREPHALFGEEVKTRNAILFRLENSETPKRGQPAAIETGPLRKWTSRTRRTLFQSIDFTPLEAINIATGIPKLKGSQQSHAFALLRKRLVRLPSWCINLTTCDPSEACSTAETPRVFVGGTAYNFLNVYRGFTLDERSVQPLSESSIHCLEFRREADARAGFAILSSRLVFWLWHVMGDGFHVPGWLFDELPFVRSSFTDAQFEQLAALGATLWTQIQQHRIVSVNGGKQTIAFRPLALNQERDAIDKLLIEAAALPATFAGALSDFVLNTVVVDPTDKRRQHLQAYFNEDVEL